MKHPLPLRLKVQNSHPILRFSLWQMFVSTSITPPLTYSRQDTGSNRNEKDCSQVEKSPTLQLPCHLGMVSKHIRIHSRGGQQMTSGL